MEKRTIDPKSVDLAALIERGTEMHGHLGPFLVAGIRMGLLALDLLGSPGYFGIEAKSETGSVPPVSCLADGIQIGSGCTTGKGNLRLVAGGRPRARFVTAEGRAVTIALRPEVAREFVAGDGRAASERAGSAPVAELFTWEIEPSS
jgi:formylmethanofuran dehydrogenase subunit E